MKRLSPVLQRFDCFTGQPSSAVLCYHVTANAHSQPQLVLSRLTYDFLACSLAVGIGYDVKVPLPQRFQDARCLGPQWATAKQHHEGIEGYQDLGVVTPPPLLLWVWGTNPTITGPGSFHGWCTCPLLRDGKLIGSSLYQRARDYPAINEEDN